MFWAKFAIASAYVTGVFVTYVIILRQLLFQARKNMVEKSKEYSDDLSREELDGIIRKTLWDDRWVYRKHAFLSSLGWPAHLIAVSLLRLVR